MVDENWLSCIMYGALLYQTSPTGTLRQTYSVKIEHVRHVVAYAVTCKAMISASLGDCRENLLDFWASANEW